MNAGIEKIIQQSISALPYYLEYLATMTGVAGILGVSAIFMIPTMVFTGKVAMASSAISGLGGRYQGNDIDTATSLTAQQRSAKSTYNRAMQDEALAQEKLGRMGHTVPANMGANQYYNEYMQGVNQNNQGWAAHFQGTQKIDDAGHATKMSTVSQIESQAKVGTGTNIAQHLSKGQADGAMEIGSITATADYVNTHGTQNLQEGTNRQTLQKLSTTATMSKLSQEDAIKSGEFQGNTAVGMGEGQAQAIDKLGGDSIRFAASTLEKTKADSTLGKAIGTLKNKEKFGEDSYIQSSIWGETSQMAQTQGSIRHYNGDVDRMQNVVSADSAIKAATQESVTNKLLQKGGADGGVDDAANKIAKAVETIAKQSATQAGGKFESDKTTIDNLNKTYKNGGYEGFMKDSAMVSSSQTSGKTIGEINTASKKAIRKLYNDATKDLKGDALKAKQDEFRSAGFIDENNNIVNSQALRIKALAQASAGNKSGMHGITVGDTTYNMSGGAAQGSTPRISMDSSTTNTVGHEDLVKYTKKDILNLQRESKNSGVSVEDIIAQDTKNAATVDFEKRGRFKLAAAQVKHSQSGGTNPNGNDKSFIDTATDLFYDNIDTIIEVGKGMLIAESVSRATNNGSLLGKFVKKAPDLFQSSNKPNGSFDDSSTNINNSKTDTSKNNSVNHNESPKKDSLKSYGNSEAHNKSIAENKAKLNP
jgi:hypothetical protein